MPLGIVHVVLKPVRMVTLEPPIRYRSDKAMVREVVSQETSRHPRNGDPYIRLLVRCRWGAVAWCCGARQYQYRHEQIPRRIPVCGRCTRWNPIQGDVGGVQPWKELLDRAVGSPWGAYQEEGRERNQGPRTTKKGEVMYGRGVARGGRGIDAD